MKVTDLKKVLTDKGLDTKGKKQDLVDRLEKLQADAAKTNGAKPNVSATPKLPLATAKPTENTTPTATPAASTPAAAASNTTTKTNGSPTSANTAPTENATEAKTDPKVVSLSRPKQDFYSAKQQRSEKFGVELKLSDEEKKNARTQRFGVDTSSLATEGHRKRKGPATAASTPEEQEKLAARAKKFGLPTSVTDPDKLLKRAKKFGTPIPTGVTDPEEAKKRSTRAERFKLNETNAMGAGQPVKAATTQ